METVELARLQFAVTAGAHFLFVALTLGLATLVAITQTRATLSNSPVHTRMVRFWGQLYIINYAMGIVTGIVMEFQFGLSWSGLTHFAGDVFGASLALETLVAFFVESTFLGLWIFGWGRLNRWAHLALIWVVTLTAYASAFWIMISNSFLQNPVGYEQSGDRLELTDFGALINEGALTAFGHVMSAGLVVGTFFMAGVSAWHLRRGTHEQEFFRKSLRLGLGLSLPAVFLAISFGGVSFDFLQPTKIAAWAGDQERLSEAQAQMAAQLGPGDYLPPAGAVQGAGMAMVILAIVMFIVSAIGVILMSFRGAVRRSRVLHWMLMLAIPIPFLTTIAGWLFRELGRQPWAVFGLLRTEDAVSHVTQGQMLTSLIVFSTLFGLLMLVNYWLLARTARRDPSDVALGSDKPIETPAPALTY
ncbi:cytochrome ubiquinol oxidase subunit I [Nonomuraea soli]|uniref:Cytochrome d ubiquinol oxidase subunit I n=1 Tax=Nonomuraea soli TaxID=1032476 RepID=A0A7W0HTQ2_9ACTN|nr:cytochrome ubiquinol oxidase subunit I [Nonomuraea soli]MBA2895344.1 cytochrome d ubiquinol oxidase subunit I [Nonomuraea soli]